MDQNRFDAITRLFGNRSLSRRQALVTGSAGLAAGALAAAGLSATTSAQDATPPVEQPPSPTPPGYLFVQTFASGSIAPTEGAEDRFTVTLERHPGETVYFTDRPDRMVGAFPTDAFLPWLGFSEDNPPNAALIVETAPGETDVAVVELFNPAHDRATQQVTYETEVLANWQQALEMGLSEAPTDLAALAPSFDTAHLFIDGLWDCPDATMQCIDRNTGTVVGEIDNADHDGYCYSSLNMACLPCQPAWDYGGGGNREYWGGQCAERFEECAGDNCRLTNFCSRDAPLGNSLCK